MNMEINGGKKEGFFTRILETPEVHIV